MYWNLAEGTTAKAQGTTAKAQGTTAIAVGAMGHFKASFGGTIIKHKPLEWGFKIITSLKVIN